MTHEGVTLTAHSLLVSLASGGTTNDGDGGALGSNHAGDLSGNGSQNVVVEVGEEGGGLQ